MRGKKKNNGPARRLLYMQLRSPKAKRRKSVAGSEWTEPEMVRQDLRSPAETSAGIFFRWLGVGIFSLCYIDTGKMPATSTAVPRALSFGEAVSLGSPFGSIPIFH